MTRSQVPPGNAVLGAAASFGAGGRASRLALVTRLLPGNEATRHTRLLPGNEALS